LVALSVGQFTLSTLSLRLDPHSAWISSMTGFDLAPGDATGDGAVNFADLVALAQNYNAADATRWWKDGDFNGDGLVEFADLVVLAQHYNTPAAPAGASPAFAADWAIAQSAAVPEPTTAALVVMTLGASGAGTRRRPKRRGESR
jgi:hypothetical protein